MITLKNAIKVLKQYIEVGEEHDKTLMVAYFQQVITALKMEKELPDLVTKVNKNVLQHLPDLPDTKDITEIYNIFIDLYDVYSKLRASIDTMDNIIPGEFYKRFNKQWLKKYPWK